MREELVSNTSSSSDCWELIVERRMRRSTFFAGEDSQTVMRILVVPLNDHYQGLVDPSHVVGRTGSWALIQLELDRSLVLGMLCSRYVGSIS